MHLDNYRAMVRDTAIFGENIDKMFPDESMEARWALKMSYAMNGLSSEVGELAGVFKKWLRGDFLKAANGDAVEAKRLFITALNDEGGDAIWYLFTIADLANTSIESMMLKNHDKLTRRKEAEDIDNGAVGHEVN